MSKNNIPSIHTAVMRHSLPEVLDAVARGGDVAELDREKRTPLFYAALDGDIGIVAELIRLGAQVNARDKNGETPLHFAARGYQADIAELLLKHGADVNAQNVHGNTALWVAVYESRGRGDTIGILRSYGADKMLKNKHGKSPEELAKSIANYDVKRFLE